MRFPLKISPVRGSVQLEAAIVSWAIGDVADARVLEVVGVELLIVLGEVTYLDSVAEAGGFEGLVPAKDPLTDGALPAGGEALSR